MLAVNDMEPAKILHTFHPFLLNLIKPFEVCPAQSLQHLHVTLFVSSIFLVKILKDITHTQTITADLVGIRRSNAFSGRPHFVLAFSSLNSAVQNSMGRHNQMCFLGNVESGSQLMPTLLKIFSLVHKQIRSQNHTVANDIDLITLEDTGRNTAKHIFLSFKLQGMSGIRATLETGYHIIPRRKNVDNLSFTFVAPLKTQQNIYFTCIHMPRFIVFSYISVLIMLTERREHHQ